MPGGDSGDLGLLGCHRLGSGKRQMTLSQALTKMVGTKFDDWPHRGPKAVREFLESLRMERPGQLPLKLCAQESGCARTPRRPMRTRTSLAS